MSAERRSQPARARSAPPTHRVAELLGVPADRLRDFVNAHHAPDTDVVLAFAHVDGVTPADRQVVSAWVDEYSASGEGTVEIDAERLERVLDLAGTREVRLL